MTAATLYVLHCIAFGLGLALFAAMLGFIAAVCVLIALRALVTAPQNGYAQRLREIADRAKAERRRTIIETPAHSDPQVVGDVSQARWPQGRYPASRPNVVRGEG